MYNESRIYLEKLKIKKDDEEEVKNFFENVDKSKLPKCIS